jgi:hypothetical protein
VHVTIEKSAFANSGIIDMIIPQSVVTLGEYAFSGRTCPLQRLIDTF